jgi:hypothetical protein
MGGVVLRCHSTKGDSTVIQRLIRLTFDNGMEAHSLSKHIEQAIGYMVCWGNETATITTVDIRVFDAAFKGETSTPEIGASFKTADGSLKFYMAAVWDGTKFTFHS